METENQERDRSNRSSLIMGGLVGLAGVLFLLVPTFIVTFSPHYHGTLYPEPLPIEDFELPRADGGTFRLSSYKGMVVVIYFGYTSCPDVCPATLYDLKRAFEELGSKSEEIAVVFISVDPERDTPERVQEYLEHFNPQFIGTVPTDEQLQAAAQQFGVFVQRAEEGETVAGYSITHSTSMFVIDRDGYLRLQMHYGASERDIASDLRLLLKEGR